jgi:hypothetical protein
MPTARNAKGIDIVAYDRSATRYLGIQVKSLSHNDAVPLGRTLEGILGDYWIIVANVAKSPASFILNPADVCRLAVRSGKEGNFSFWLEYRDYSRDEFRARWDRIVPRPEPGGPMGSFTQCHSRADEIAYKDF